MASYQVAYRVARCKKPHNIAEKLILPAALDIITTMLGSEFARKVQNIPLSNDTIARRVNDLSDDLKIQLIDKLRDNHFALQVDEATDSSKDCHLIAYVRYVHGGEIYEDLLFCKPILKRATSRELFNIIDNYIQKFELRWINCVGICTDGAKTMSGNHQGLQALIKREAPEVIWTHCIIHREALASKELSVELVIKSVNYIKTRPVKARFFSMLCDEMGADHRTLRFYCESRWLSRGKVLTRVFKLRKEFNVFLVEEKYNGGEYFSDELFLLKLAYLSDIFEKLNELNISLQGKYTHIFELSSKVIAFQRKIELWERNLEQENLDMFPNLREFIETNRPVEKLCIQTCIRNHLASLKTHFLKYFFRLWIRKIHMGITPIQCQSP